MDAGSDYRLERREITLTAATSRFVTNVFETAGNGKKLVYRIETEVCRRRGSDGSTHHFFSCGYLPRARVCDYSLGLPRAENQQISGPDARKEIEMVVGRYEQQVTERLRNRGRSPAAGTEGVSGLSSA